MKCTIVVIVTLAVLCIETVLGDGPINYCGAKMCGYTNAHTFCQYPPGPHSSCMGHIEARLTAGEKALVMARLNRRRSEAAQGIRNWPTAGDMHKLRWVEELAREAQRWADQCQPPSTPEIKDACRDLYSTSVGQCVASVVGEAPGLRIGSLVDMWHMQSMLYKGSVTSYTVPDNTTSYYSDFAQMIWSRAFMVGCGRSRFMTQWHGRLRSVERLVCNFAPRGPLQLGPLWSPAPPATACPPRSRPDTDLPALCTFHYSMDETYDEDNIMPLEEHLMLNTILEIEKNASLDYLGSIDEFYLTKLTIATIEMPILTLPSYNSIQKRDLIEKIYLESVTIPLINKSELKIEETAIVNNTLNLKETNTIKKKGSFVGRPKTYDVDDLNNPQIIHYDNSQETTTVKKYIYDDYEFIEIPEDHTFATSATSVNEVLITYVGSSTEKPALFVDYANISTEPLPISLFSSDATSISNEGFEIFLNNIIPNLTLPQILNESAIDSNVLDDYLSDPETVRQLQNALDRMERNLASSATTSGKVRRELRRLQPDPENELNNDDDNGHNNLAVKKLEDLSGIERNKSIDRGPMLNMVLKYVPYLKPYEKSIIGDSTISSGVVISPSFILFLVLCC